MSFDFTKTLTDTTPIYAVVGVADQAVSQVKDAVDQATRRTLALREDLAPKALQSKVTDTVTGVRSQVEALPGTATSRFESWTGEVDKAYTQFATRGEQIVRELLDRPEVEQVTAAVGTVRKVAEDAQATALGAVYSGRKQAAQETVKLADAVEVKAESLEADAKTSVRSNAAKQGAATKPAAKKQAARTTTAKKAPAKKQATRKTATKKA